MISTPTVKFSPGPYSGGAHLSARKRKLHSFFSATRPAPPLLRRASAPHRAAAPPTPASAPASWSSSFAPRSLFVALPPPTVLARPSGALIPPVVAPTARSRPQSCQLPSVFATDVVRKTYPDRRCSSPCVSLARLHPYLTTALLHPLCARAVSELPFTPRPRPCLAPSPAIGCWIFSRVWSSCPMPLQVSSLWFGVALCLNTDTATAVGC